MTFGPATRTNEITSWPIYSRKNKFAGGKGRKCGVNRERGGREAVLPGGCGGKERGGREAVLPGGCAQKYVAISPGATLRSLGHEVCFSFGMYCRPSYSSGLITVIWA